MAYTHPMFHDNLVVVFYIASGHPIIHMAFLSISLFLFIEVNEMTEVSTQLIADPLGSQTLTATATDVQTTGNMVRYHVSKIAIVHVIVAIFHLCHTMCNKFEKYMLGYFFLVLKTFYYFLNMLYLQQFLAADITQDQDGKSFVHPCKCGWIDLFSPFKEPDQAISDNFMIQWLLLELIIFYVQFIAIIAFIVLAKFVKVDALRDRVGLPCIKKDKTDFLDYMQYDIRWFMLWFTNLMLFMISLSNDLETNVLFMAPSKLIVGGRIVLMAYLLCKVLLASGPLKVDYTDRLLYIISLGLNVPLGFFIILEYASEESNHRIFRLVALTDFMINSFTFIIVFTQVTSFKNQLKNWLVQIIFEKKFLDYAQLEGFKKIEDSEKELKIQVKQYVKEFLKKKSIIKVKDTQVAPAPQVLPDVPEKEGDAPVSTAINESLDISRDNSLAESLIQPQMMIESKQKPAPKKKQMKKEKYCFCLTKSVDPDRAMFFDWKQGIYVQKINELCKEFRFEVKHDDGDGLGTLGGVGNGQKKYLDDSPEYLKLMAPKAPAKYEMCNRRYGTDFVNVCFVNMTKAVKWKYKIRSRDMAMNYFESLMLIGFQVVLTKMIVSGEFKIVDQDTASKLEIMIAQLMTNILLHMVCVGKVRHGIDMMQQVQFNPDEFSHPEAAFALGVIIFVMYVGIEGVNILSILTRTKFNDILQKFVSYSIILNVHVIYFKTKNALPTKQDIYDNPVIIKRPIVVEAPPPPPKKDQDDDDDDDDKQLDKKKMVVNHELTNFALHLTYEIFYFIYSTGYFYMFQVLVIILPFLRLMTNIDMTTNLVEKISAVA